MTPERIYAEAVAFPLLSDAARERRTRDLCWVPEGEGEDDDHRQLVARCEEHVRARAPGYSMHQIRQFIRAAWFYGEDALEVDLVTFLLRVAERLLVFKGHRVVLRGDKDRSEHATQWRWLTLRLPEDLLVAASVTAASRLFERPFEAPARGVQIVTPQLARVLQKPCAETHLHLGSGMSFELLWTGLMHEPDDDFSTRLKERARDTLVAAITRFLLALYLREHASRGEASSWSCFAQNGLRKFCEELAREGGSTHAYEIVQAALAVAWRGTAEVNDAELTTVYRAMVRAWLGVRISRDETDTGARCIARRDPLSAWLVPEQALAMPETRFATRALRYAAARPGADPAFEKLFWQYQRLRGRLYRDLVEEPGTPGLEWFSRNYDRIWQFRRPLEDWLVLHAIETAAEDVNLVSFEGRTAPRPDWGWNDVVKCIRTVASCARSIRTDVGQARPEVGLVLHFIKRNDEVNHEPREGAPRHAVWFKARWREALTIGTAIERHPELLMVLRGIDVAARETAQPTWALAPLFRYVRSASVVAVESLLRQHPDWRPEPLRATVHAGEEFCRLPEGLRRMHEAIESSMVEFGDRFGHGLALGADPLRESERRAKVFQSADERFFDLVWEMERYASRDIEGDASRIEFVRSEVQRIARTLFDKWVSVEDLIELRRALYRKDFVDRYGYPTLSEGDGDRVAQYLKDPGVWRRGRAPLEVSYDAAEVNFLQRVQAWLRALVGRMEITIEMNPSSNLLINAHRDVEDHPAFNLLPLRPDEATSSRRVMVSVNTDNPLTFASHLADEFAYVHNGLMRLGKSSAVTLDWIDRAREAGFNSRFTLGATKDERVLDVVIDPENSQVEAFRRCS